MNSIKKVNNGMDNLKHNDEGLRELALFAGAGGGILGGHLLGWRTVCAVEYNAYARSVLLARQNDRTLPTFPIWDDVLILDIITSLERGKWTRNTNTAQSAIASFAASHLPPEIKIRRSSAAPTLVAGRCKHARRPNPVRFAGSSFCRQGLNMKLVRGHAGQSCGCQDERLTLWSKSGGGSPCSAAASLLDASETKQTGQQPCLATPLSPCGRILRLISSRGCLGKTTAKGVTHGA